MECGKRRRRVHGRNLFVKLELCGLRTKTPLRQNPLERAELTQQHCRALRTDPAGAGELVGRIATQSDEVGHLLWLDAIALAHLIGADARHLAAFDGMENGGRGGGKLKCIAIATGYHHRAMAMLLVGHGRGQKIVGLITRSFRIREAARRDEPRQHIQLIDELFVEMSTALIIRKEALAVGRRTERVPPDKHCARPLISYKRSRIFAKPTIAPPPRSPVRRIDFGKAWKARCANESPSTTSRGPFTASGLTLVEPGQDLLSARWRRSPPQCRATVSG